MALKPYPGEIIAPPPRAADSRDHLAKDVPDARANAVPCSLERAAAVLLLVYRPQQFFDVIPRRIVHCRR